VVTPAAKCQLRLLKLNRVLDFLKMEHELVANQEAMKPQEEKNQHEREHTGLKTPTYGLPYQHITQVSVIGSD
jgi:hypothetical protein